MESVRRERLAKLKVVFNRLGGECRFDEAKHMLNKCAHRVFYLAPKGGLGVDHLQIHFSNYPCVLDDHSTYNLD
jgi:hypothetical protein